MKFYISQFYYIRFFKMNEIPVSTAVWDPSWYKGIPRPDKRGVWIGFNDRRLNPPLDAECKDCNRKGIERNPKNCSFLDEYYKKISKLDFKSWVKSHEDAFSKLMKDPIVVLMVHETPDNPCSERHVLKKWFEENGEVLENYEDLMR